jgi:ubiquinone/menaquinone biosynthesis C-methylase UbiE
MKTEWDYTELAVAYLKRPQYAPQAIAAMLKTGSINSQHNVCDIGAGVGHLTKLLLSHDLRVIAIEPNDSMREIGILETRGLSVSWHEATGENTDQETGEFDLVTFGSSFNVCDRSLALEESARILKSRGWFACMWNHRLLSDPLQSMIEGKISDAIPEYTYGTRREDQFAVIDACQLFENVTKISARVSHRVDVIEFVEAWRSHATLERQAGEKFNNLVAEIEKICHEFVDNGSVVVPYETNLWMAQKKI